MKTKVLAALVATMAVGATCAFAANPFVDVPSDSWAYKSVVELADAGIIQGVDGSYFQGERNITRYEAAEMVAKAMAHMDKASVEQRALINKLADEYADELNNLGVRVSNLENKIGNVKLTGDARLRYKYQNGRTDNDNSWDYRVRLRANAKVNDKTTVTYGISSNNHNFANNDAASDGEKSDVYTDMAKVDTKLGANLTASVGRDAAYNLGNGYGYNYGDAFDRAQLKYNNGKVAVTAGYGKFKEGDDLLAAKTGYGELEGFFGNGSAVGVYYNSFNKADSTTTTNADDLWGAYASVNMGSKWNALANYERVSLRNDSDKKDVWIGKLTYGGADENVKGSWDAWVEYLDTDKGSLLGGATNSWRDNSVLDGVRSWGVGVDYTLAKNVILTAAQSFGTSAKGNAKDPNEFTDVELNFLF